MGPVKPCGEGAATNIFPSECFELQTPTGIQVCKKKKLPVRENRVKESERHNEREVGTPHNEHQM